MGVAEGLDGGEGDQVLEVEVRVGLEGGLEGAEGEDLCFRGGDFFGLLGIEGAESFKDVLV